MRTHASARSILPLAALALSSLLAACSQPPPSVTVQGHQLVIAEQSYGQSGTGTYCSVLDPRGQYEIVITDFTLCSTLKPNSTNAVAFHSSEETNLRLIFSSAVDVLKKVPNTTVFNVGTTHNCMDNAGSATAVALFAHNPPTGNMYDVLAEADSGTISVNYFAPPSDATGSFDLHFGGDHITGSFDAQYCKNLAPGLGR